MVRMTASPITRMLPRSLAEGRHSQQRLSQDSIGASRARLWLGASLHNAARLLVTSIAESKPTRALPPGMNPAASANASAERWCLSGSG